jgi:hypothetical protein
MQLPAGLNWLDVIVLAVVIVGVIYLVVAR